MRSSARPDREPVGRPAPGLARALPRAHPFSRTPGTQWKAIRDPERNVPRSGAILGNGAARRTLRVVPCWVPGRLPLALQAPGTGAIPGMNEAPAGAGRPHG